MTRRSPSSPRRRVARALVAPIVLPHELAHALVARVAGLDPTIELLPRWEGQSVPLGRFDAVVDATTPTWVILNPAAAREAGRFVVPPTRWQALSIVIAPATTLAVAALLVG